MAKKIKITQVKSSIGSQKVKHVRTLRALGLKKNYRTIYRNDTPQIRGMIRKIDHLVRWEEVDEKDLPVSEKRSLGLKPVEKAGSAKGGSSASPAKDAGKPEDSK